MDETETDVDILLECLKCQTTDFQAVKRNLQALASVFNSDGDSKEYFRRVGGLHLVRKLLSADDLPDYVLQAAVFCLACAVENDVFCQNTLTKREMFEYLHKVLSENTGDRKWLQAAVFLIINLVASNSVGQKLAKECGVLADLLSIFRQCADRRHHSTGLGQEDVDLCLSVVTALSMCVNNPQNEVNQRLCCTILPLCFQVVVENEWRHLSGSLLAFTGLTIAGNTFNQKRMKTCGGLDTLLQLMSRCGKEMNSDLPLPSLVPGVISVINACISDHQENAEHFVAEGGVETLMTWLSCPQHLSPHHLLQLMLTLGQALEYADRRLAPLTHHYQNLLVQLLTDAEDEELVRAIKYVLTTWQHLDQREETGDKEPTHAGRQQETMTTVQRIDRLAHHLNTLEEDRYANSATDQVKGSSVDDSEVNVVDLCEEDTLDGPSDGGGQYERTRVDQSGVQQYQCDGGARVHPPGQHLGALTAEIIEEDQTVSWGRQQTAPPLHPVSANSTHQFMSQDCTGGAARCQVMIQPSTHHIHSSRSAARHPVYAPLPANTALHPTCSYLDGSAPRHQLPAPLSSEGLPQESAVPLPLSAQSVARSGEEEGGDQCAWLAEDRRLQVLSCPHLVTSLPPAVPQASGVPVSLSQLSVPQNLSHQSLTPGEAVSLSPAVYTAPACTAYPGAYSRPVLSDPPSAMSAVQPPGVVTCLLPFPVHHPQATSGGVDSAQCGVTPSLTCSAPVSLSSQVQPSTGLTHSAPPLFTQGQSMHQLPDASHPPAAPFTWTQPRTHQMRYPFPHPHSGLHVMVEQMPQSFPQGTWLPAPAPPSWAPVGAENRGPLTACSGSMPTTLLCRAEQPPAPSTVPSVLAAGSTGPHMSWSWPLVQAEGGTGPVALGMAPQYCYGGETTSRHPPAFPHNLALPVSSQQQAVLPSFRSLQSEPAVPSSFRPLQGKAGGLVSAETPLNQQQDRGVTGLHSSQRSAGNGPGDRDTTTGGEKRPITGNTENHCSPREGTVTAGGAGTAGGGCQPDAHLSPPQITDASPPLITDTCEMTPVRSTGQTTGICHSMPAPVSAHSLVTSNSLNVPVHNHEKRSPCDFGENVSVNICVGKTVTEVCQDKELASETNQSRERSDEVLSTASFPSHCAPALVLSTHTSDQTPAAVTENPLMQNQQDGVFRVPFPKPSLAGIRKGLRSDLASGRPSHYAGDMEKSPSLSVHSVGRKGLRRAPNKTPVLQQTGPRAVATKNTMMRGDASVSGPMGQNGISGRGDLVCSTPLSEGSALKQSTNAHHTVLSDQTVETHRGGQRQSSSANPSDWLRSTMRDTAYVAPQSPAASEFDCQLLKTAADPWHHVPQECQTSQEAASAGQLPQDQGGSDAEDIMPETLAGATNTSAMLSPQLSEDSSVCEVVSDSEVSDGEGGEYHVLHSLPLESFSHTGSDSLSETSSCLSEVYNVTNEGVLPQRTSVLSGSSFRKVCPGCSSQVKLTSRTFNVAIETCGSTCPAHRSIRQLERDYIRKQAWGRQPPRKMDHIRGKGHHWFKAQQSAHHDGSRFLSMCEERRLRRAVAKFGHNWTAILRNGHFSAGRTVEELKEHWKMHNKTRKSAICC
ncbi:uncharacterized protein LOC143286507 [Babylonia areolata]|uniref:uncharacterized protein LOC143286507 n=1 Tax=Babylonia areolata TaxID=304850 RepID=UPI003FD4F994